MKKLALVILFAVFTSSVFALTAVEQPKNLSVKIDFNYVKDDLKGHIDQYLIKNKMTMDTSSNQWSIVQNRESSTHPNRFVLLSKVAEATAQAVTMNFLILDMANKANVVSEPKLVMKYGEKAEIAFKEGDQRIQLSVVAKA
jgi:hypothetical protein